jgi:hypothetical protein
MNISEKIEKINQKPEHERIRYVWGMVAISMFFIIALWIVSLKDTFTSKNNSANEPINIEQISIEEAIIEQN